MEDAAEDACKIEEIVETVERCCFFTRNQGPSENTDSYATKQSLPAKTCNFGTLRDSFIHRYERKVSPGEKLITQHVFAAV